jgi:hypothetical protein
LYLEIDAQAHNKEAYHTCGTLALFYLKDRTLEASRRKQLVYVLSTLFSCQ